MKTLDAIRGREYWTPGECARLYPQGESFFKALLDRGDVEGFDRPAANGRRRYLNAESVRGYFRRLEQRKVDEQMRYAAAVGKPEKAPTMAELVAKDPRIQAMREERVSGIGYRV